MSRASVTLRIGDHRDPPGRRNNADPRIVGPGYADVLLLVKIVVKNRRCGLWVRAPRRAPSGDREDMARP